MASETIKLMLVITSFRIEKSSGGAGRYGLEVALRLNQGQFSTAVYGMWREGTEDELQYMTRLQQCGVETVTGCIWHPNAPYRSFLKSWFRLKKWIDKHPVDIIHCHSEWGDIAALWLKMLQYSPKIIRTVHDGHWMEWRKRPLRRYLLTNFLYPLYFNCEVGVSSAMAKRLNDRTLARLLKRKASVLRNGIDLRRFQKVKTDCNAKLVEFGIPEDAVIVGSIGRITEQKGYKYLVDAAVQVIEETENLFFVLLGDGDLLDELKQKVVRLGLQSCVVFTGACSNVEEWLCCFTLFVSSSLWEGIPTVVMESMASGVPIIATDIPGNRELIHEGENGWLVSPRDVEALASAIVFAIRSPELRTKFSMQAQRDAQAFSFDEVGRRHEKLYRDLVDSG